MGHSKRTENTRQQKYKSNKLGVFKVHISNTGKTLTVILVWYLVVNLSVPDVHQKVTHT